MGLVLRTYQSIIAGEYYHKTRYIIHNLILPPGSHLFYLFYRPQFSSSCALNIASFPSPIQRIAELSFSHNLLTLTITSRWFLRLNLTEQQKISTSFTWICGYLLLSFTWFLFVYDFHLFCLNEWRTNVSWFSPGKFFFNNKRLCKQVRTKIAIYG